MLQRVLSAIDSSQAASVEGLSELLRIPSISTRPEHAGDVARCAKWLSEKLEETGLQSQVLATAGHPIVLARTGVRAGKPTVLLYGHYDVQPVEPLDQWITPPFKPEVRDGAIYARGAADDKGQVWAHLQAIAAWQRLSGLPINLIVLLEGEEEIGSPNLPAFVREHREELKADVVVVSDTNLFARGIPAITYGLRGLVYEEVTVTAADHDLHSGLYGGAVPNPANILCELLASLHGSDGRVKIPGFYEDVVPLSKAERAAWAKLPFDEGKYAAELKLAGLCGEKGYSTMERKWARPTCDINGLTSGYQGAGAKTIIPSTASAKVSMRLVPKQDPEKIHAAFEKALRERCPANVTLKVELHSMAPAALVPADSAAVELASEAIETGFGTRPALIREGGSIPVVGLFKSVLGIDTLLVGFGLPDDRVHSPNEKFDLECLRGGTRTAAALYEKLAGLKRE